MSSWPSLLLPTEEVGDPDGVGDSEVPDSLTGTRSVHVGDASLALGRILPVTISMGDFAYVKYPPSFSVENTMKLCISYTLCFCVNTYSCSGHNTQCKKKEKIIIS